ncbi:MAG: response regulator, partial [Acidobacteriia bacterium]|nr:response regulator [Terriglobia bacterium]
MRVVLQRCCSVAAYHVVDQPTSLERHLRTSDYDVILSDHDLGAWVGLEALQLVQRLGKDIPFIVVTATLGDEAAVEYIKRGASHYVLKTHLEDLPTAIHQALLEKAARGAAAKLWEQLQQANREWEQVFNTVPDPVLVLDEDCRIRRANEAAASILGVGVPEMLGRPCHEVVHGRSEPLPSCPHQLLINGGTAQSGDVEEKRLGKIFHSSTAPLRDSNGIL